MKALSEVDITTVNSMKFMQVLSSHTACYLIARTYAFNFLHEVEARAQNEIGLAVTDVAESCFSTRTSRSVPRAGTRCAEIEAEITEFEKVQANLVAWDDH